MDLIQYSGPCYRRESLTRHPRRQMDSAFEIDTLLIQRIRGGDSDAWNDLIARYEGRLLAFAESRVGRRAASEDIVQETFIGFLNSLHADHLVLELAHRPDDDLLALKDVDSRITLGLGVVDVKVNHVETPDEIASRIEKAEQALGENRVGWVHPDCGFWMLKRSVADRKIEALVKGRDRYLGIS